LNEFLGISLETYLSGTYLNEFSQTSQFFTTTAKVRRGLTEQLVDLALPTRLALGLTERRKGIKSQVDQIQSEIQSQTRVLEYMRQAASELQAKFKQFELDLEAKINQLADKTQTQALGLDQLEKMLSIHTEAKCKACGIENKERRQLTSQIQRLELELEQNFIKLEDLGSQINPYTSAPDTATQEKRLIALNTAIMSSKIELADIDTLAKVIEDFRMMQVNSCITQLQEMTNQTLSKHFDGEIRVSFEAEEKDKLEATVYKDGHLASYTQLSKGQRQMLKLAFGVAVMKLIAQFNAVTFNTMFFDECLTGLDESNAVKAYGLFEELSLTVNNIFIVDHCEAFKSSFVNKIMVDSINGESQLGN